MHLYARRRNVAAQVAGGIKHGHIIIRYPSYGGMQKKNQGETMCIPTSSKNTDLLLNTQSTDKDWRNLREIQLNESREGRN